MASELTVTILRFAFLGLLWFFVFFVVAAAAAIWGWVRTSAPYP